MFFMRKKIKNFICFTINKFQKEDDFFGVFFKKEAYIYYTINYKKQICL